MFFILKVILLQLCESGFTFLLQEEEEKKIRKSILNTKNFYLLFPKLLSHSKEEA